MRNYTHILFRLQKGFMTFSEESQVVKVTYWSACYAGHAVHAGKEIHENYVKNSRQSSHLVYLRHTHYASHVGHVSHASNESHDSFERKYVMTVIQCNMCS